MDTPTIYASLQSRAVMITGGATGIGAALVAGFAAQGCRVGFVDIDAASAQKLCTQIEAASMPPPWFREVDVTNVADLKAAVTDFAAAAGRLDVLVSNVANDARHDPLTFDELAWRKCLAVNLDSAFFLMQAGVPAMKKTGGGSIIIFSSINPVLGLPDMPGYVAAKAGLIGLARSSARQFGPDNIRVNTIMPGWVVTDRQLELWLTPEAEASWFDHVSLKRRIRPIDVAKLAVFLASDDSAMITGQQFVIDAGRI